jgi:hypothetical protein
VKLPGILGNVGAANCKVGTIREELEAVATYKLSLSGMQLVSEENVLKTHWSFSFASSGF